MLTDRGTELCGKPDDHEYELYLAIENMDHTRTRRAARRAMASASRSTRRCSTSSSHGLLMLQQDLQNIRVIERAQHALVWNHLRSAVAARSICVHKTGAWPERAGRRP